MTCYLSLSRSTDHGWCYLRLLIDRAGVCALAVAQCRHRGLVQDICRRSPGILTTPATHHNLNMDSNQLLLLVKLSLHLFLIKVVRWWWWKTNWANRVTENYWWYSYQCKIIVKGPRIGIEEIGKYCLCLWSGSDDLIIIE